MTLLNRHSLCRNVTLSIAGISLIVLSATAPVHAQSGTYARASFAKASKAVPMRGASRLINAHRRNAGLGPVRYDPRLHRAAITQARLMAKYQKLTHATTWGAGFSSRMSQAGIRTGAAENVSVGYRSASRVIAGWMRSPSHRVNMLGSYNRFGMASARDARGRRYWAIVLAR